MKTDSSSSTPKRAKFTPAQRAKILQQFSQSGMSAAAFARKRGIGYSTLCSWIQTQAPSAPLRSSRLTAAEPRFVELALPGSPPAERLSPLGVRLPSGIELTLHDPQQVDWAARLIAQLQEPSC